MEQQLTILLTAVLASIGTAAVPGAGIIMLIIVLQSVGLDPAGLALILAVDRPLDMLRTVVNITGDATVASIVANCYRDWFAVGWVVGWCVAYRDHLLLAGDGTMDLSRHSQP